MFRCMSRGEELVWLGEFTTKEVYGEEKLDGVARIYTCNKCELDYEISIFKEKDDIEVVFYERKE